MDKDYIQRLKEELPILTQKFKSLEDAYKKTLKENGTEHWYTKLMMEKVSISKQYLFERKQFIKNGVPKNVNQSAEVPYDLIEGF